MNRLDRVMDVYLQGDISGALCLYDALFPNEEQECLHSEPCLSLYKRYFPKEAEQLQNEAESGKG